MPGCCIFSDYYHEKTAENDYLETRSIRDDFGRNLMTNDYTEEDWNQDLNFFAQCLQFYLAMADKGIKIQPPMENIIKRKYKADMGASFEDWAYGYFAEEGEHVNQFIQRDIAYDDFVAFAKVPKSYWTMQRFTKALKGFANLCPYIEVLNPEELLNASGRLLRKVEGQTKEMIFLRTIPKGSESATFIPDIDSNGNIPF